MRQISDDKLKAQITLDEEGRVRQLNHLQEPWESGQESPLLAAVEYLRRMSSVLGLAGSELRGLKQKVSFNEPRKQGVRYRLGDRKELFDSSTFIFNQTYLNVPVWRAAITLTIKHHPNRVITATDTSQRGMDARLPPEEKIEEHRRIFALAEDERRLRALGRAGEATAAGLAEGGARPETASFVRRVLGRGAAGAGESESAEPDDAQAIRGRFFVYRYDERQKLSQLPQPSETPELTPAGGVESAGAPTLALPPVDPSVADGSWRLVSEVTFSLRTPEYGPLNWRALIDVQTDSVLFLEPLIAGLNGLVFLRDPITSTGDRGLGPDQSNGVLNPLRSSVELPNLSPPVGGVQSLLGRFAAVVNVEVPDAPAPTRPAGVPFDYEVRTDDFAAVNAYYHTDHFFALVESLGFPVGVYFNNTAFPLRVDHRCCGNTINAHCTSNGVGGIGHVGYALNDLTNIAQPLGRACDSRVHLHELGGHGVLYEHVGSGVFGFAHSAGDALSAIFHDPDSALRDDPLERFRYAPWNPRNKRRFDRTPEQGWAWGGPVVRDEAGRPVSGDDTLYGSEQILATTLFRVYRSIGGDSPDLGRRRFASRTMLYLILRAIGTLTPATNPDNALGFADALRAADFLDWTSEGVFGGAYHKVIRWSFEKQGLYQAEGASTPVMTPGEPPDVDVFIDDGRGGEYQFQPDYSSNPSVWNRRSPDGGDAHEEPAAGVTNYAYVRVRNRGTLEAADVRVRGFQHRPGGATLWPTDFQPLATAELPAGSLAARDVQGKVVGPFAWVPNEDALGRDSLLMVVSADGDRGNVDHFTAAKSILEWRLVPNDNNLGLRHVVPTSAG